MSGPLNEESLHLGHLQFEGTRVAPLVRKQGDALKLPHNSLYSIARPAPLIECVLRMAGLRPGDYRTEPLLRRLPSCLRSLNVSTSEAALELLTRSRESMSVALDSVLLGVTGFFRDTAVFNTITGVISTLSSPLRVWSVGCSSGEELYSIAILLDENRMLAGSSLLGTDVRPAAIAAAREGKYLQRDFSKDFRHELMAAYFEHRGDNYFIRESVKKFVCWEVGDAFTSFESGTRDMIICRNMMMYLQPCSADRLARRLFDALAPDGVLIVGRAEKPPRALPLEKVDSCVYAKKRGNG